MSAEPALLSAIRDRPDDDTPRLAHADWLDDAGDPARAEFVRVQVQLARLPHHDPARPALEDREHALLAAHEPAWLGVPPDALTEWEWERGFVNEVAAAPEVLNEHGRDLFGRQPVRRWRVTGEYGQCVDGVARTWGDQIEGLDLRASEWSGPQRALFLTSAEWPRLTELEVNDGGGLWWLATAADGIRFRDRLRVLHVSQGQPANCWLALVNRVVAPAPLIELGASGFRTTLRWLTDLFSRPTAHHIAHVDLSDSELAPDVLPAFARPTPALAALDVSGTPLAAFALDPLLQSPALAHLRELNLNRCGSAANVVPALLRSPFWRQAEVLRLAAGTVPTRLIEPLFAADGPPALRTLDLTNNFLYDAGVADLCNASWAGNLTWLGLTSNYLTDGAAERIAASGRFRQLRTLHMSYNHPYARDDSDPFDGRITDRGAVALATSPGLARLRVLTLTGVPLTAAGVDALVNGPFWRLAGLGLGSCDLKPAAVKELAASPRLARLSFLDLSRNRDLRGDALRPLAESPHLSPQLELDVHGCGASDAVLVELARRLGRRLGA